MRKMFERKTVKLFRQFELFSARTFLLLPSQNILSKIEALYFVWFITQSGQTKGLCVFLFVPSESNMDNSECKFHMIFVKNSRGRREVNMINTLSKINLSQDLSLMCLAWKGFLSCLEWKSPRPKQILHPKIFWVH